MKRMAKKLKLMPLFQELKGRAEISNRRPNSTAPGVYLMQLREQTGSATLPRRRLVIAVNSGAAKALPRPVKIHHTNSLVGSPSPGARPVKRISGSAPQVRPDAA